MEACVEEVSTAILLGEAFPRNFFEAVETLDRRRLLDMIGSMVTHCRDSLSALGVHLWRWYCTVHCHWHCVSAGHWGVRVPSMVQWFTGTSGVKKGLWLPFHPINQPPFPNHSLSRKIEFLKIWLQQGQIGSSLDSFLTIPFSCISLTL